MYSAYEVLCEGALALKRIGAAELNLPVWGEKDDGDAAYVARRARGSAQCLLTLASVSVES